MLQKLKPLVVARLLTSAARLLIRADARSRAEELSVSFDRVMDSMALPYDGPVQATSKVETDTSSAYGSPYLLLKFKFVLPPEPDSDSPEHIKSAFGQTKKILDLRFKHAYYKGWPVTTAVRPAGAPIAALMVCVDPDKLEDTAFKQHLAGIIQLMTKLSQDFDLAS